MAAVATQPALFQKTISNMVEVKSRGAFVLAVTCEGNREIEKAADYVIYIPITNRFFTNSLAIIPLQLFSYYVAVGKGCDNTRSSVSGEICDGGIAVNNMFLYIFKRFITD